MDQKFISDGRYTGYQDNDKKNKTFVKKIDIDLSLPKGCYIPNFWEGNYNLFMRINPTNKLLENVGNLERLNEALFKKLIGTNVLQRSSKRSRAFLDSAIELNMSPIKRLPKCYRLKSVVTKHKAHLNIAFEFYNIEYNPHQDNRDLSQRPFELLRLNIALIPEKYVRVVSLKRKSARLLDDLENISQLVEFLELELTLFCGKFVSGDIAEKFNSITEAKNFENKITLNTVTNINSYPMQNLSDNSRCISMENQLHALSISDIQDDIQSWNYDGLWTSEALYQIDRETQLRKDIEEMTKNKSNEASKKP